MSPRFPVSVDSAQNIHIRGHYLTAPTRGEFGGDMPDDVFFLDPVEANSVYVDPAPETGAVQR